MAADQDLVIMKLDCAKQALAEAKTIQQTKKILDIAGAAETYAKRQKLSAEVIERAYAIKVEAWRLLGKLLKDGPKATGGQPYQVKATGSNVEPVATLATLGITKKDSMNAQRLADLPEELFEQVRQGTTTVAKALRAARSPDTHASAWSLDSVEQVLRVAINRAISDAPPGSQPAIADLLRRLADELDEAGQPERRDAVAIARDELGVRDAEPGAFRIFEDEDEAALHPGSPTVIAACKSTHSPWYRHLTTAQPGVTPLRRRQIEARLDDIEVGTLPTKQTRRSYWAVVWAIQDLPSTSWLSRGAG